jgi:hypothetical protein
MRYQPNFCNNCGEKIERAASSFTDSKQFCDVCKHDFVLQRALPVAFAGLMAIVGIFGIGSYWRSGEKPLNVSTRQFTANSGKNPANNASQVSANSSVQQTAQANNVQTNKPQTVNLTTKAPVKQTATERSATETVYFCGAPTKKGTPCSRRVKGGGRCWQHQGQSAMLPPEKLLAGQ